MSKILERVAWVALAVVAVWGGHEWLRVREFEQRIFEECMRREDVITYDRKSGKPTFYKRQGSSPLGWVTACEVYVRNHE